MRHGHMSLVGLILAVCGWCAVVPVQAYVLFTEPDTYDSIWKGTDGGGTIDNSPGCWFDESHVEKQTLSFGNFGAITPQRYKSVAGVNNILIGSGSVVSNTGLTISNGSTLWILNDSKSRDWYPNPTLTPGLTMINYGGFDARTLISGGGTINQAVGNFTLNDGSLFIGDSGVGTYNIEGGTLLINEVGGGTGVKSYDIHVGSAFSTTTTGGTGTLRIAGDATVTTPGTLYVGEVASGVTNTGTVVQSGGTVNVAKLDINNGAYSISKGTLNVAKGSNVAGRMDISGTGKVNLTGLTYQTSGIGGADTIVNISDNGGLYFNTGSVGFSAGTKVTINLSGGELSFGGVFAIGENGTFILNQTGGKLLQTSNSTYGANGTGSVVEMNLSHGSFEGTIGAGLCTRGQTRVNISGDYQWNASGKTQLFQYGFGGANATINQTGADTVVTVGEFRAGNTNGNATATYNLSAGTLTTGGFSFNGGMTNIIGNLNLVALTNEAGNFSTPTAGGTANVTNITDYSARVTAGTLKVTGTYKSNDHATTLTVGGQKDASGATTEGKVEIALLENVPMTVTGGEAKFGTVKQTSGKSTISGGNVSVGKWELGENATLELLLSENFKPLEITGLLDGLGTLEVALVDGFKMDENKTYTLISAEGNDALIDISQMTINTNGLTANIVGGNYVLQGANTIPEPATWLLLLAGFLGLSVYYRKMKIV